MKILVFAGSNSSTSINLQFATYVSTLFQEADVKILKIAEYETAIYSSDREQESGIPAKITEFAREISNCDLIIHSLAEHNGSYVAGWKNMLDWMSRIPNRKVFDGKPMFLLSTSGGERGGQSVMEAALIRYPRHGTTILDNYSFPSFDENFDCENQLVSNPEIVHLLKEKVKKIEQTIANN